MSEYQTTIATTTVNLIEDAPDIVNQSLISSIYQGTDIVGDLKMTMFGSLHNKVYQAYNYAKSSYTNGLPEGTIGKYYVNPDDIVRAIAQDIDLESGHSIHLMRHAVSRLEITAIANECAYWEDMELTGSSSRTHEDNTYLMSNGNLSAVQSVKSVNIDEDGTETMDVVLIGKGTVGVQYETKTIRNTIPNDRLHFTLDADELYVYAAYIVRDSEGKQVHTSSFWCYQISTNKYPYLSNLVKDKDNVSYYLPVIPLRVNNVSYGADNNGDTELYKTSKQLCFMLGLDFDDMITAVEENPDVDKIDHAYFMFGVNVFEQNQATLGYVYKFFHQQLAAVDDLFGDLVDYGNIFEGYDANIQVQTGIRHIAILDDTYAIAVLWDGITKTTYAGKIGKVGEYAALSTDYWAKHNTIVISYQAAPNVVTELRVHYPYIANRIYNAGMTNKTTLSACLNNDDPNNAKEAFVLPINVSIVLDSMSWIDANKLYYTSFKIVANSYDRRKLKWYETGFWKCVLKIVSIVIAIWSGNYWAIFLGFAMDKVIDVVLELAISIFGEEWGLAIGTAVLLYVAYEIGDISSVFTVISVVTNIAINVANRILDIKYDSLNTTQEEIRAEQELKEEELSQAKNALKPKVLLDPLAAFSSVGLDPRIPISDFVQSKIDVFLRLPEVTLATVYDWHEMQLRLPEANI